MWPSLNIACLVGWKSVVWEVTRSINSGSTLRAPDALILTSGTNEREHCGLNPHVIPIFKNSVVKHLLCLILSLSHVLHEDT